MLRALGIVFVLLLAACAGRSDVIPALAAGPYRLDYSGVYGTGRVELLLQDGHVGGLSSKGDAITYRGTYRTARDGRHIALRLIAHLPPMTSHVQGVAVVSIARDVPVEFDLPANMAPGARWPIRIETQYGPVSGMVTRLDGS